MKPFWVVQMDMGFSSFRSRDTRILAVVITVEGKEHLKSSKCCGMHITFQIITRYCLVVLTGVVLDGVDESLMFCLPGDGSAFKKYTL